MTRRVYATNKARPDSFLSITVVLVLSFLLILPKDLQECFQIPAILFYPDTNAFTVVLSAFPHFS